MTTPSSDNLSEGGHAEVVTPKGAASKACDHVSTSNTSISTNYTRPHMGIFESGHEVVEVDTAPRRPPRIPRLSAEARRSMLVLGLKP